MWFSQECAWSGHPCLSAVATLGHREEPDSQLRERYQENFHWPWAGLWHESSVKGTIVLFTQELADLREDKSVSNESEVKKCGGMPLLTDLALMMRIDPLALIFGLREFVTMVYGPTVAHVFPDIQNEAYRPSVLYVNRVSVVDCSVINWMEQRNLRGLAIDDRLFGKISESGWVLIYLNNSFKCRMGGENLSNVQFIQPRVLKSTTHHQGYDRRSENPGLAGDMCSCEGESGHMAFWFNSAAE